MTGIVNIDKALINEMASQIQGLQKRLVELEFKSVGWKDNLSSVSAAGVPSAAAPTMTAFGVSGNREEMKFAINDYVFMLPFHANHDIKPGGKAYLHVHWSTDGADINPVHWEMEIMRATRGGIFSAPTTKTIIATPRGAAWYQMVDELGDADVFYMTEPDELVLITLKRVTNGATDNTDAVYGLMCDAHYESDRDATPQRDQNFYDKWRT